MASEDAWKISMYDDLGWWRSCVQVDAVWGAAAAGSMHARPSARPTSYESA